MPTSPSRLALPCLVLLLAAAVPGALAAAPRALATQPQMLLLDESFAGLNPSEQNDLITMIREIRSRGITIMVIEHHMKVIMSLSDRIVVLNYGQKIAEGTPQEISSNPLVIEAYLGEAESA